MLICAECAAVSCGVDVIWEGGRSVREGRGGVPVEQDNIPFHFPMSEGFRDVLYAVVSVWIYFILGRF